MPIIKIPRGTKAALNALASANGIIAGQPYLITDENRIALGLTVSTYETFAKVSETNAPLVKLLTGNVSSSSTTPANVTDWSIPILKGKNYLFEIMATYQTGVTTTGGRLGMVFSSGGAGLFFGKLEGGISNAAVATELVVPVSSISSFLLTSGVAVINTAQHIGGKFIFECTQTGNLVFTWASEVGSTTAQLNQGSAIIVQTLN